MPSDAAAARRRVQRVLRLVDRGEDTATLRSGRAPLDAALLGLLKLEVEHLVRVDPRRALRVAAGMERLLPESPDRRTRAVVARAKAEAFLFLGRYREALDTYRETVRLFCEGGDALEGARASVGQIPTLMYLSRYGEALRIAHRAEGVLRRHGEKAYLGRLFMNKGNLYFQMDRYAEALVHYRRARHYLRAVTGRDETVVGLEMNEAAIHTMLDDMTRAEEMFRGAVDRARAMGWRSLAAQGEFNQANVLFLQSRFQDALAALSRAGVVLEADDQGLAAIAEATRSEIYVRLNMAGEAAILASTALARFRKLGMRYDAALARHTLGVALVREGASVEGKANLLAARRFFDREGNRVRSAVIDIHLSRIFAAEGHWGEARKRAREAERAFRTRGLESRAALARLARAEIELSSGRVARARALLLGVPARADSFARFERTFLSGRIAQAEARPREALLAYRRAADLAGTVRASLAGEEHKIAIEGFRAEVAERAAGLLLSRLRRGATHAPRVVADVFAVVEGGKARALGDLLADLRSGPGRAGRAGGATTEARLDDATRRLAWGVRRLEQEQLRRAGETPPAVGLARSVAALEREIAAIHRRAREEAPTRRDGNPSAAAVPALADVRSQLDEDEIIVEYFAANDRLHAIRIERRGARIIPLDLPLAPLDRLVERLGFQMHAARLLGRGAGGHEGPLLANVRHLLEGLGAVLIAPLGEIPDGSRVMVIPHGVLHRVPFEALGPSARPLLTRAQLSWLPSVATAIALRGLPASRRRVDLVGGHADRRAPGIRREIATVARSLARRRPIVHESLASDEFLRLAPQARLIHLATHGRFREDNPQFSALRFADRWVHLYEILNLDLDADLVVLTGCETGAGRRAAGDEVLGLARGFLSRGARRLIVSRWPIDDRVAAQLAGLFHAGFAGGLSVAEALRRAALAVREEHPHPYYWSPLTLVGSGARGI